MLPNECSERERVGFFTILFLLLSLTLTPWILICEGTDRGGEGECSSRASGSACFNSSVFTLWADNRRPIGGAEDLAEAHFTSREIWEWAFSYISCICKSARVLHLTFVDASP